MVKAAGFIEGMAEVMGLPVETVRVAFRALRTEGLLTSGARGVNAPDMTAIDAARMLIWGMVSDRPMDAVNAVRDFGSLSFTGTFQRDEIHPQYKNDHFSKSETLELALARTLNDLLVDTDIIDEFEVAELEIQSSDLIAVLVRDGTGFKFEHPFIFSDIEGDVQKRRHDNAALFDLHARYHRKIKQIRTIGTDELQEIADLIASK